MEFVAASRAWLTYRDDFCAAVAAPSAGGTIAPVITARCDARQDAEHVTDLRTFRKDAYFA